MYEFFETEAEREEREATQAGQWVWDDRTLAEMDDDAYEEMMEEARTQTQCCTSPWCPCPKGVLAKYKAIVV